MNFILDNWYLIVLALASGAMLLLPAVKGAAGRRAPWALPRSDERREGEGV